MASAVAAQLTQPIDALREPRVVEVMRDARLWTTEHRRHFPDADDALDVEAPDDESDDPESRTELPEILCRFRSRDHAYSELKRILIEAVEADDAPILRGSLHDLLRHLADELEL